MADEKSAAPAGGDTYLYEFLFRGRAPGSSDDPAYHVILAQDAKDAFGQVSTSLSPAMTPEQAKEHGFDISKIVEGINASLTAESASAKAALTDAERDRDSAKAGLAAAQDKLDAVAAALAHKPAD